MTHWKKALIVLLWSNLSITLAGIAQKAQPIVDVAVVPEKTQVALADTFSVMVQIHAGSQAVVGATANLKFDPAVLEVVKTIPSKTLESQLALKISKNQGNVIYSAGTLASPVADTFDLIQIRFKAISKATQTILSFDTSADNPEKTDVAYYGATSVLHTTRPANVMIIVNNPPIAKAGKDIELVDEDKNGIESVTLDGSASTDSDGEIMSYEWKIGNKKIADVEKPVVDFNTGSTTVTLVVTDDQGATSSDEVIVTINEPANKAPIANAGEDQTVEDSDEDGSVEVQLDGSASSDADGSIASYSWSLAGEVIATEAKPKVVLEVGRHIITLTITDDKGLSSVDDVTIVVNPPGNQLPIANAGVDIDVLDNNDDSSEEVPLDGSASEDKDGTITAYSWQWGLGSATGSQPKVKLPVGSHTVVLTITDDQGAEATDTVIVLVRPLNQPPQANAGEDITVEDKNKDGVEEVTLDGSASTEGSGKILTYSWSVEGKEMATGMQPTVALPVGETIIMLTVTDDKGKTSTDEVKVTVLAYMNILPVADAGPDQDLMDEDGDGEVEVTLDGSKSLDEDGIIEAYAWTYEGLQGSIVGINPKVPLPVGNTEIILTVKDNRGETAQDTVVINIQAKNDAPIANAGPGQEVTDEDGDGEAEVTLNGSASTDSDGTIDGYVWYNSEHQEVATGVKPVVKLPVGVSEISLVITDDRGATDTSSVTITVMKPLAVEEVRIAQDKIIVFPNPSSGYITIISSKNVSADCIIVNAQGKTIGKSKMVHGKGSLDLSLYPAGIYYLVSEVGGKRTTQKLIIH